MVDFNLKNRLKVVAITLGLLLPNFIHAQESDLGNWLIYIGNKKIDQKWDIHHEVQYRNYNAIGDLEQLLLRTGLGRTFNDGQNNFLVGYGYILSENYIPLIELKTSVNEHRLYQQFTAKNKIGDVKIGHRYRFEQRFIEDNFKMRFRYFLSLSAPLCKNENDEVSFYLSAYNEIFLSTEPSVFDRNRLYGGIGYNVNKSLRVELGYMNQFFEFSGRDQVNVIAFLNF